MITKQYRFLIKHFDKIKIIVRQVSLQILACFLMNFFSLLKTKSVLILLITTTTTYMRTISFDFLFLPCA